MFLQRSKAASTVLVSTLILLFLLEASLYEGAAHGSVPEAATEPSVFASLQNFDIRKSRVNPKSRSRVDSANREQALKPAQGNVTVSWNDELDLPHHLLSTGAPLTSASTDDPPAIAKRFVRDHTSLFGISRAELDSARVSAQENASHNGFTRLVLEQQANGIRVFDSEMLFILDVEGRVYSQSGSFIPGLERGAPDPSPALAPEQALTRAAELCGANISVDVGSAIIKTDRRKRFVFSSNSVDPRCEAGLVYYPITRNEVRLAYQVLLYGAPSALDAYLVLVDAHNGELLRRDSLTHSLEPPLGRVFTRENPTVSSDREMVSLRGDAAASPAGWVSGASTAGNNTAVFFNPNLTGGNTVNANEAGHFDFPIDLTSARSPLFSSNASAVNLFYWVNFAHDRFYALGFNETSRNFQSDNLGKGGQGFDPVRAETLRGAAVDPVSTKQLVRNNAFFQTSLDGTAPLLAMLLWTATINGQSVELDSSYDAGVIIHEYTHGVSTRLAGTEVSPGLRSHQGAGMGEGWSDFFAMSFLNGDLPAGTAVSTGSYVTRRARGVRNFPYSTNFNTNPLTFGDIRFNTEAHAQGTVWCSMLWDMRQAYIERYGFQAGKERAERLVIDGLKATPLAPTFVDARDAILLADRITENGANQDLIWRAFARRGLGKSATAALAAPATGFRVEATEGYDVPPEFSAGTLLVNDKPLTPVVIGEPLPLMVIDRDLTASSIDVLATNSRTGATVPLTLTQSSPGSFRGGLTCLLPGQEGGASAALPAEAGDEISITYVNLRNEAGVTETLEMRTVAGRRVEVYAIDFERRAPDWSLTSFWHLTQRRAAGGTHALYFARQKGVEERRSFTPPGSNGTATSPVAEMEHLLSPRLEFDYAFVGALQGDQANSAGDIFTLTARNIPLTDEDPRLQVTYDLHPQMDTSFRPVSINLSFIGSRNVFLILNFSASTASLSRKKLEGFYIDNVRVTAIATSR